MFRPLGKGMAADCRFSEDGLGMVVRAAESAGLKFAQVKKCRGERSVAA